MWCRRYYSGSPEYAGTVNVVRLSEAGGVTVTRAPLDIAREVDGLMHENGPGREPGPL